MRPTDVPDGQVAVSQALLGRVVNGLVSGWLEVTGDCGRLLELLRQAAERP
jgi:hypothetical protein